MAKIRLNTFKLSPEYKDVPMESMLEYLKENLPEYEYTLVGKIGKGIRVKKSFYAGALVAKAGSILTVKAKAPSFLATLFDIGDIISTISGAPKVAHNVLNCIGEKYRK